MHRDDALGRTRLANGRTFNESLTRLERRALDPYRIRVQQDGPKPIDSLLSQHQGTQQAPEEPPPAHVAQRTARYIRWLARQALAKRRKAG